MMTVVVTRMTQTTDELISLRRACLLAGQDEFDTVSWHMVGLLEGRIVGAVRLTEGERRVLHSWTSGAFPFRQAATDIDLTRGFVINASRGLGIYRALMLSAMLATLRDKRTYALAAVEPDFHHLPFLRLLRFKDVAAPMTFHDRPRTTVAIPLVCAYSSERHRLGLPNRCLPPRHARTGTHI